MSAETQNARRAAGPAIDPPKLRPRQAAFGLARRRVPISLRNGYWRAEHLRRRAVARIVPGRT